MNIKSSFILTSVIFGVLGIFEYAHAQDAPTQEQIASIYFERDPNVTLDGVTSSQGCALGETAKSLIIEIVNNWRDKGKPHFVIYGHNDTEETKELSLMISACRAARVSQFVQDQGVDLEKIHVFASGESSPAFNTEDGVTEPLNRRVEVVFYSNE